MSDKSKPEMPETCPACGGIITSWRRDVIDITNPDHPRYNRAFIVSEPGPAYYEPCGHPA